jgi:hypothetical protein
MKLSVRLILLLIATTLIQGAFGQDVLLLRGALKDTETQKKLDNCQVTVFKNGQQFDVYDTGGSGKYEFRLELGYNYDIKFSRVDYVSKIVRIDTRNIPEEDKAGGFQMDLPGMLFTMQEGYNTDIMKEPVGKVAFSPQTNSMEYDEPYANNMKAKIEAELKRLKSLEDGKDKMIEDFNKLVKEGDQRMIEKKYKDAMDKFTEALKIFPQDAAAKQKYDAAKAAYDAELALAADNAKYDKLLVEGEAAIKSKKWDEAKKKYTEAKDLKPKEKTPKEKLYEIEQLMAGAEKQGEYDALMTEANKMFSNKDYALCIDKYRAASALFPSISEPKDQIVKAQAALDGMLADEAKKKQLEQRYNDLMALGAKNKGEDKLDAALGNYKEARDLKSEEQQPKDRIKEIEDILAQREKDKSKNDADALANKEKEEIERKFNDLIQQADKLYTEKNWSESKGKYNEALAVKEAQYPHARIASIDEILAAEEAKNSSDALADAARQREEEAKLKEAQLAADKAEQERLAEEARLRRQKEQEEAEAEAKAELLKKNQKSGFKNEADRAREDEVERYYRQSRAWQDSLKYADVRTKAENNEKFSASQKDKSNERIVLNEVQANDKKKELEKVDPRADERLKEQEEIITAKKEELTDINNRGNSYAIRNAGDNERKKEEIKSNEKDFAERAETRNEKSQEDVAAKKEADAALAGNDRNREKLITEMDQKQETYQENTESYESRSSTLRTDATMKIDKQKEDQTNMTFDGEKVREQNELVMEEKKKEAETKSNDSQDAAKVRIEGTVNQIEAQKESSESMSSDANRNNSSLERAEISEKKTQVEIMAIDKEAKAAEDRYQTRKELFDVNTGQQQTEKASPGTEDLPEGVSETSYEVNNKMITERTVKRDNKVDKYLKSVSKTGIYYFKNGKPITKQMWIQETLENESN